MGDLGSAPEVVADALALPSDSREQRASDGRDSMHNMHAGLSQVLAVELMAERREPAAHGRVLQSVRPPGRRRRQRVARVWWRLVRRPVSA